MKSTLDTARDLVAVLTVGTNSENSDEDIVAVFEDVIDGDIDDAVALLVGVTAFLGGVAEAANVDLSKSIEFMALALAVDPEQLERKG